MIRARGKSIAYTCGLVAFVALVLVFCLSGCAVGFTKTGGAVVGLTVGEGDADSARQVGKGLGESVGQFFGPAGTAIGGQIGDTIGWGLAALLGWKSIKRERSVQQEKDELFEETVARNAGTPTKPAVAPVAS